MCHTQAMPQLVIPGAALLRLIWTRGGAAHAVNVIGVINDGPVAINQTLANTLGTAVKAGFTSSGMDDFISTTYALAQVGIRDINVANQAEFLDTGGAVAGSDAGQALPPQIALVITLRTALAGPRFRGRVYLPGWTETVNDAAGLCTSAAAEGGRLFIASIYNALVASGMELAVLSRPRDADLLHVPPITARAGVATPSNVFVVRDLVWDTQRRRAVAGI